MTSYYDNTAYNPYATATKVINEFILNGFAVEGNSKHNGENVYIPITQWVKIGTELNYRNGNKHAVIDDIMDGIITDFSVSYKGAEQAEKIRHVMHNIFDNAYYYLM